MLKNFIKKMRRSTFDFNVVDGRTIGEITLRPLIDQSADLLVVDVGAKNEMQLFQPRANVDAILAAAGL